MIDIYNYYVNVIFEPCRDAGQQKHPRGYLEISNVMQNTQIVEKLLSGSRNIDKMRKEIDLLMSMVTGLILKNHWDSNTSFRLPAETRIHESEDEGKLTWDFYYDPCLTRYTNVSVGISIACHERQEGKNSLCIYCFNGNMKRSDASYPEFVQRVHGSLPSFIKLVTRVFPFLDGMWKPFLSASDAATSKLKYCRVQWRKLLNEPDTPGDMWASRNPNEPERQDEGNLDLQMRAVHPSYYGKSERRIGRNSGDYWRPVGIVDVS